VATGGVEPGFLCKSNCILTLGAVYFVVTSRAIAAE
jgi:hypothetical protein